MECSVQPTSTLPIFSPTVRFAQCNTRPVSAVCVLTQSRGGCSSVAYLSDLGVARPLQGILRLLQGKPQKCFTTGLSTRRYCVWIPPVQCRLLSRTDNNLSDY